MTAAQTHITPILALGAEMFKLDVPSVIPDIVMMIELAVRSKEGWPQREAVVAICSRRANDSARLLARGLVNVDSSISTIQATFPFRFNGLRVYASSLVSGAKKRQACDRGELLLSVIG